MELFALVDPDLSAVVGDASGLFLGVKILAIAMLLVTLGIVMIERCFGEGMAGIRKAGERYKD